MEKAALFVVLALVLAGCGGGAEAPQQHAEEASAAAAPAPETTPDAQVAALDLMCQEAAPAMKARQADTSLYERLGGREGIHGVVAETVRLHGVNPQISHLLDGVDTERLVAQVTDFLVVATGGEGEYHGRDMATAHAHLGLTNADFLAAGGDLGTAMESAGWGENERQEVLCAFVALRPEVVTD